MYIMVDNLKTLGQVAKHLGVAEHRLIHLCESGVVDPVQDASGRGTVRRFDGANVLAFALSLELQGWGMQVDSLRRVVRLMLRVSDKLREKGDNRDLISAVAEEADGLMATFFLPDLVVFENVTGYVLALKLDDQGQPHPCENQVSWPEGQVSSLRVNLQALARRLRP